MSDFPYTHTKDISHYPTLSAMPTKQDVWDWLHDHEGFDMLAMFYNTSGELVYVEMSAHPILVVSIHDYSWCQKRVYTMCSHFFNLIEDTYKLTTIPITEEMYQALKPFTERLGGAEVYVK